MSNDLDWFQKIVRLYTFYSPIRRGKYRLALSALNLKKDLPKKITAKTKDGRSITIRFDNHFAHFVYFLGEYEIAVTEIIRRIVQEGDVCLDIGANVGWFTTLLQIQVGKNGQVHSFEPVADTFEMLEENVKSNENSSVVFLNNFALGDEERAIQLYLPKNTADGHASISNFGHRDAKVFPGRMITLDSYLKKNGIKDVRFVKADIEGAELAMLKGAKTLFEQEKPPIWEIEMALDTTRGFGYLPNDLIKYIGSQREYDFYAIDEESFAMRKIENFAPADVGANVLCVPRGFYLDKLAKLKIAE